MTYPLSLEYLTELVYGDAFVSTQHICDALQLLGQVYLLLISATEISDNYMHATG